MLGLSSYHNYDATIPLVDFEDRYPYEDVLEWLPVSVEPLGAEYRRQLRDVLAGQIHLMFENLPVAIQHVRSGRIRAVGVTSKQRSPSMPEVPTIAESGLPEYDATAWFTIGAPAKMPMDIVRKLNADIDAWIKSPDMQGKWRDMGVTPMGGSPEVAAKFFASEVAKWNRVIKAAGIRAD